MKNTTVRPKYWHRIEKYVKSDNVQINTDMIDRELGNILLLRRLRKNMNCATMAELKRKLR